MLVTNAWYSTDDNWIGQLDLFFGKQIFLQETPIRLYRNFCRHCWFNVSYICLFDNTLPCLEVRGLNLEINLIKKYHHLFFNFLSVTALRLHFYNYSLQVIILPICHYVKEINQLVIPKNYILCQNMNCQSLHASMDYFQGKLKKNAYNWKYYKSNSKLHQLYESTMI